jgi:hypothetical protein
VDGNSREVRKEDLDRLESQVSVVGGKVDQLATIITNYQLDIAKNYCTKQDLKEVCADTEVKLVNIHGRVDKLKDNFFTTTKKNGNGINNHNVPLAQKQISIESIYPLLMDVIKVLVTALILLAGAKAAGII